MSVVLYNGVPLPQIPTNAECPYAVLVKNVNGYYTVCLCKEAFVTPYNDNSEIQNHGQYWISYRLTEGASEWEFNAESTSGVLTIMLDETHDSFVWTSHDICDIFTGDVQFAASEPVPVSTWKPDPISMVMGWLVGRRLSK